MPHPRRKRASQAVRSIVAYNQDYKCRTCGDKLPVGWELDHIVPLCDAKWATTHPTEAEATAAANAIDNLQALCPNCHGRKSLIEASEPGLAAPVVPKAKRIPWQAVRLRRRHQADAIWALASPRDQLRSILTSREMWTELEQASTDKALRRIHRKVEKKGRRIDYEAFKQRVDHLMAS